MPVKPMKQVPFFHDIADLADIEPGPGMDILVGRGNLSDGDLFHNTLNVVL